MNEDSLGSLPEIAITIKRGGVFYLPFTYTDGSTGDPIDLTGYRARLQIWTSPTALGSPIVDISSYGTSSTYGTIAIDLTSMGVSILLSPTFTSTLPNICTRGWYEFHFLDANSIDVPMFEGPVNFEPGGIR